MPWGMEHVLGFKVLIRDDLLGRPLIPNPSPLQSQGRREQLVILT